jgi:hypothetical protein
MRTVKVNGTAPGKAPKATNMRTLKVKAAYRMLWLKQKKHRKLRNRHYAPTGTSRGMGAMLTWR